MKTKKEAKGKNSKDESAVEGSAEISTKEELRTFLLNVRDKMREESAAPIFALSAINHVMNLTNAGALLDNENKELSRDIWLRLKQSGLQLKNPPMLFSEEDDEETAAAAGA